MAKTERLDLRLDSADKARIMSAAEQAKLNVSAFAVPALLAAADKILGRADVTLMPAEQFDALIASLEVPDPAPAMDKLRARPRTYTRV